MAAYAAITIVPPHPPLAHTRSLRRTSFAASARVARITDMRGTTDRVVPTGYVAPARTRQLALRGVELKDRARLLRTLLLDGAALPHSRALNTMKPGLRGGPPETSATHHDAFTEQNSLIPRPHRVRHCSGTHQKPWPGIRASEVCPARHAWLGNSRSAAPLKAKASARPLCLAGRP